MSRRIKFIVTFVVLTLYMSTIMTGCLNNAQSTNDTSALSDGYWPTSGWKTSTPEEQGMDSGKIYEMFKYINDNKININDLLIVKNGYMITEGYFYPYKKEYRHILNSCTKSITSALVGLAIEDKFIKDVDQKVLDVFSGMSIQNVDERKKNITIRNLLTMTSGLDWNEEGSYSGSSDSNTQMWGSKDQLKYVLDKAVKNDPGKNFYYNTGTSLVLSAIVQKTSGKTSLEYAKEKIFKPLGISDVSWKVSNQGIYSGGGGMFMKPEDMAKYGYLYLKKGKWDDKQIIPQKWVEESTKKQLDTPNGLAGRYGYGYQWWQNKFGGYSARGAQGQYIFVLPEYNMVVVFTSGLKNTQFYAPEELVESYIIPAIKSSKSIGDNKDSGEALKKMLEDIQKAPTPKAAPKLPEIAGKISGKTYVMDNKETFSFEFKDNNECSMHWFCDGIMYDVKIGLDDIYRNSPMKEFYGKGLDTIAGFKGSWTSDSRFFVDLKPLEDGESYTMEFNFKDDTLSYAWGATINSMLIKSQGSAKN